MTKQILITYEIDEDKKCLFFNVKTQTQDKLDKPLVKEQEELVASFVCVLENREDIQLLGHLKLK